MTAVVELSALRGGPQATEAEPSYSFGALSFRKINRLTQQRKTYEDIPELADEFAASGWLEPPLVAVLTPGQAMRYLAYVNRVFGSEHTLAELMWLPWKNRRRRYAIMIAGHRRLLANHFLWESGCSWCREEYGDEPPGTCFRRHLATHARHLSADEIEAKLFEGIEPREALLMQCSENDGIRRPPAHETADTLYRHLTVLRADFPDLSMAAFARIAKVKPGMVANAVRYCRLPENIRSDVESGALSFTLALELGRLVLGGASPETVAVQHQGWLVERPEASKAAKRVHYLLTTNNRTLDGTGDTEIVREVKKANRQPFERKLAQVIYAAGPLFERAKTEIAAGNMGLPDAMFRDTTVMNSWRRMIQMMEAILPDLRRRLGDEQAEHDEAILAEVASILEQLAPPEADLFSLAAGD